MVERFPEIEPFGQGMLKVGDGQRIYWEVSGNPDGKPAVAVPRRARVGVGSGAAPAVRSRGLPDHPVRPSRLAGRRPAPA